MRSASCATSQLSRPALDAAEQAQLDAILARCPHLHALAGHLSAFAEMMTGLHGQHLPEWLAKVEAGDPPHLHSFAAGIRRDLQAVTNGITLAHGSGAVEGTSTGSR